MTAAPFVVRLPAIPPIPRAVSPVGSVPVTVPDAEATETEATFDTLKDARSLGSIMKFDISPSTRRALADTAAYWRGIDSIDRPEFVNDFLPAVDLILALTDSYDAIVMNPPYMPTSKEPVLKKYAADNYPDSKADLFAVFMDVCIDRLKDSGKYGMINMQSWMFLSSFEALRKKLISEQHIDSLLHIGPRTFDELSGEVVQNAAFVITKSTPQRPGVYHRLIDGKNCAEKESLYLSREKAYPGIEQTKFEKIPGYPIAYWVSDKAISLLNSTKSVSDLAAPRQGFATSDNERFLKFIWEIDKHKRGQIKWAPCAKGGSFRRWYGNIQYCANWENDGCAMKEYAAYLYKNYTRTIKNIAYYFKQDGCTWSTIASGKPAFRLFTKDCLFETKGSVCFPIDETKNYSLLGYLNSPIVTYFLAIFSPTLDFHEGPVGKLPLATISDEKIDTLVKDSVSISKQDWDAHETSWDFQENELIAAMRLWGQNCADLDALDEDDREGLEDIPTNGNLLSDCVRAYKNKWERMFRRLHANEEELNRRFIEIYGLQDELTPDVPLSEVTILQQGEIKVTDQYPLETEDGALLTTEKGEILTVTGDEHIEFQVNVIIKQLISYIVGVWMGRYRLDRPGLNIAHPEPTAEELSPYTYGPEKETLVIDDDAIIPILPKDSPFEDNLANRIDDFVRIVWGRDTMNENLNFIEQSLGKSIEDYVHKDFWKDHKRMYQNRPIYWLFSSKKGAFKVLVYAHRMNKHTVSKIRSNYLLKYIKWLEDKVTSMEARAQQLSTRERKDLDCARKSLDECHEYHNRLQQVAESEITFDLDDGILHNYALFGDVLTKL